MAASHPFYPTTMKVENYQPNDLDVMQILGYFFGLLALCIGVLYVALIRGFKGSAVRKLSLMWFLLCGFIHTFLEGHFSVYNKDIQSRMDFLSQVWKEYGKGDSRYMIQDPFTVCMETITAFVEGPLSFLTVWAFIQNYPSRYLLQLCVSLGQFYGCVLYFATEWMEGFSHGPYNHPLYFWFYFVFMNALWIIIPFILIIDSWLSLSRVQSKCDLVEKKKK